MYDAGRSAIFFACASNIPPNDTDASAWMRFLAAKLEKLEDGKIFKYSLRLHI
jgi:hypothetical protein